MEGDDLSELDRLIVERAILGCDMTEVVGTESAKRLLSSLGELLSKDIMEMYSPERVAKLCADFGLRPGASLDLTNGFDFDTYEDRKRAWDIVEKDEPSHHREPPLHVFQCAPRALQAFTQGRREMDAGIRRELAQGKAPCGVLL